MDYSGHYWVISTNQDMPVFSKKGYWVYTADDNVEIHSKYRYASGWWR